MRGSFPGEELNLSLAGPGLLSVAWWKQHGGAGRAERLRAPVQQGPTNQAVPALKDVFGLWSVPGVPRIPGGLCQLCHGTRPAAPLGSAAPMHGLPVALGGEECPWGAQQFSWFIQRVETPKSWG